MPTTVWWTREGRWWGGYDYTFFDPSRGQITGEEAKKLRKLIEGHPNAVKRGALHAMRRKAQVWVDRVPGKVGVTKGSAGILMDIPDGSRVLETIKNEWLAFDQAHRVGALRLVPRQARELEQVLEYIGRSAHSGPSGIATAGIVAGAAIGFALLARMFMRRPAMPPDRLPYPWSPDPCGIPTLSPWGAPLPAAPGTPTLSPWGAPLAAAPGTPIGAPAGPLPAGGLPSSTPVLTWPPSGAPRAALTPSWPSAGMPGQEPPQPSPLSPSRGRAS